MNRTWKTLSVTSVALAAGLTLGASALTALADPPPSNPSEPALKGPAVHDKHAPGTDGDFGGKTDFKKASKDHPFPPRFYMQAVEVVLAPDAPDNIRAPEDQREKIHAVMDDFRKQMRDYTDAHKDELQAIRQTMRANRPHRGPGGPDGAPPPPAPDTSKDAGKPSDQAVQQAREKLRTIMEAGPKPADAFNKVWLLLTPEQQKAVQARLDTLKQRDEAGRQKSREGRGKHRRGGPDGPGGPGGPDDAGGPGGPKGHGPDRPGASAFPSARGDQGPRFTRGHGQIDPQMRDRLVHAFARLSPEQQARLLSRVERQSNAPHPGFRGAGEPTPGPDRPLPAPEMDVLPPEPAL